MTWLRSRSKFASEASSFTSSKAIKDARCELAIEDVTVECDVCLEDYEDEDSYCYQICCYINDLCIGVIIMYTDMMWVFVYVFMSFTNTTIVTRCYY
jgi:hypothetical protein